MDSKRISRQSDATLRQKAEILSRKSETAPQDSEIQSHAAMRKTLHELRVNQIELEMQNEELRLSQVALDISRARYFDLYDLAPIGYCSVSERGQILEANLAAVTMLGVTRKALIKQPFSRFILAEDADHYYLLRKKMVELSEPQVQDLRMVKEDGSSFWVRLAASLAREHETAMLRIALSDVTELKRVEEDLRENINQQRLAAAEAQRQRSLIAHQGRLVILGELASALAHEINQPLTAIAGFAAACARKTVGNPGALELVRAIEEQALRGGEIAWRMRGFARRQSLGRNRQSMAEVVAAVVRWIRIDIAHLEVDIDTSGVGADLPQVNVDRIELEQVLINLVQNGIEAGLTHTHVQRIAIAGSRGTGPDELEISVTDWGCGLASDANLENFQPFTTSKERGLGLGLTICFSIIEGHGGRLWATANPQGGTVFHFTLPTSEQTD